jgi:hypothetical protein
MPDSDSDRPLVIATPLPRTLPLLFAPERLRDLFDRYDVVETTDEALPHLPADTLREARYVIGQPPLSEELLARMESLRCIFNVESNLLPNMPYDQAFERGIHVVTTGAVFRRARGRDRPGLRAIARPWHPRRGRGLPRGPRTLGHCRERGRPATDRLHHRHSGDGRAGAGSGEAAPGGSGRGSLPTTPGRRPRSPEASGPSPPTSDTVLSEPETLFVTAAVTTENQGFLGRQEIAGCAGGQPSSSSRVPTWWTSTR